MSQAEEIIRNLAEIRRHQLAWFDCGTLNFSGFRRPDDDPRYPGRCLREEIGRYVVENGPFSVGEIVFLFVAGPVVGIKNHEYNAVKVTGDGGRVVYFFRMRAIVPGDEEEFVGHGSYKWRICGYSVGWPATYRDVTWTHK